MVIVTGKYPQAQLVGLRGLGTLLGDMVPVTMMSARYTPTPDSAPKSGDTNYSTTSRAGPGCAPGVSAPCTCADGKAGTKACGAGAEYAACNCTKPTNWLLWGGLALGAVVAWRVLR
jgi:hypothetical protein